MASALKPNRIAELREARGWNQSELARKVGTSQQQIQRLEAGDRKLSQDWLERLGKTLGVAPADILGSTHARTHCDVVESNLNIGDLNEALRTRGLYIYRIETNSMSGAKLDKGMTITVDKAEKSVEELSTGDIAIIDVRGKGGARQLLLRQFVAPRIFVSNPRSGPVDLLLLDDITLDLIIVGVVVRANSNKGNGPKT